MLTRLAHLTHKIKEPSDYYQGISITYPLRPTNLLCFHRSNTQDLYPDNNRSRYHHHRFVLINSIKGHGYVCIDTKKFFIKEGQSILIFPFQFHHYFSIQPNLINWVFITFEMMESEEVSSLRFAGAKNLGEEGEWLLKHFLEVWPKKTSKNSQSLGYYTALLLHNLCQKKNSNSAPLPPISPTQREDLLLKVNQYLMPRLHHPVTIDEISKAIGMSKSYLCATFQKHTGNSLGNHVRLLRMQKAAGMLVQTSMTISEISDKCGFDSIYSFSRTFKSIYGLSPRAYRRKLGL